MILNIWMWLETPEGWKKAWVWHLEAGIMGTPEYLQNAAGIPPEYRHPVRGPTTGEAAPTALQGHPIL